MGEERGKIHIGVYGMTRGTWRLLLTSLILLSFHGL